MSSLTNLSYTASSFHSAVFFEFRIAFHFTTTGFDSCGPRSVHTDCTIRVCELEALT